VAIKAHASMEVEYFHRKFASAYLYREMAMVQGANQGIRNNSRNLSRRHSGSEKPNIASQSPGRIADPMLNMDQLFQDIVCKLPHGFLLCERSFRPGRECPDLRILKVNAGLDLFTNGSIDVHGKKLNDLMPELASACGFALIQEKSQLQPKKFCIHRLKPRQDYEAIVMPLPERLIAIFLVDLSVYTESRQSEYEKLEKRHKSERQAVERQFALQSSELDIAVKNIEELQYELDLHQRELARANKELVRTNDALSVLARHVDRKRDEFQKQVAHTICSQILPLIEELYLDKIPGRSLVKLDVLTAYLRNMIPQVSDGRDIIVTLSPMELRVAVLVSKGFSSEAIARMLNVSIHTVKTHRRSIRRKLNIRNVKVNLSIYLKSKLGGIESLE
jgi:DNA-binding CsgD family transcriptional regulator